MCVSKIDYSIKPDETWIIKAIAIMAMLFHHLFLVGPEYGQVAYVLARAGKICVALFVFLSGYGMATSFPKDMPGKVKTHFFVLCKRYAKFFLNYWFVFFIAVPVGVFCFGHPLEVAYGENANVIRSFISDMLGQQSYSSYNVTWWFNGLILGLWLLFPLLYWLMTRRIFSACLLAFLLFCPKGVLNTLDLVGVEVSSYILTFSIGIFLALRKDGINKLLNRLNPFLILGASVVIAVPLLYWRAIRAIANLSSCRIDPFATVFIALAVVCLCRITKRRFVPMQYVGRHSMNMYLTHTFIFGYFFHDFIYGFKFPILIFLALFTTSLLQSVCIEFVKRRIGFYRLQGKVVDIINRVGGLVPKK